MDNRYEKLTDAVNAARGQYEIFKNYESALVFFEALRALGLAYQEGGEPRRGMKYIQEAKALAKALPAADARSMKLLIRACCDAAAIYLGAGAFGGAQTELEEGVSLAGDWVAREESRDSFEALSACEDNFGQLSLRAGYPEDAIDHFAKAEEAAYRSWGFDQQSQELGLHYCVVMGHLGEAKQAARDVDGALAAYEQALGGLNPEPGDPLANRRAGIGLHRRIAAVLSARMRMRDAEDHLLAATALADGVVTEDGAESTLREAVLSYFALARLHDARGDGMGFRMYLMKTVSLARENVAKNGTPAAKDDLAVALCTWGEKTYDRKSVEDALAIWEGLCAEYPNSRVYPQKKGYAQNVLSRL